MSSITIPTNDNTPIIPNSRRYRTVAIVAAGALVVGALGVTAVAVSRDDSSSSSNRSNDEILAGLPPEGRYFVSGALAASPLEQAAAWGNPYVLEDRLNPQAQNSVDAAQASALGSQAQPYLDFSNGYAAWQESVAQNAAADGLNPQAQNFLAGVGASDDGDSVSTPQAGGRRSVR